METSDHLHWVLDCICSSISRQKVVYCDRLVLILLVCHSWKVKECKAKNCVILTNKYTKSACILIVYANTINQMVRSIPAVNVNQVTSIDMAVGTINFVLTIRLHGYTYKYKQYKINNSNRAVKWIQSSKKRRISARRWGGSSLMSV